MVLFAVRRFDAGHFIFGVAQTVIANHFTMFLNATNMSLFFPFLVWIGSRAPSCFLFMHFQHVVFFVVSYSVRCVIFMFVSGSLLLVSLYENFVSKNLHAKPSLCVLTPAHYNIPYSFPRFHGICFINDAPMISHIKFTDQHTFYTLCYLTSIRHFMEIISNTHRKI